MKAPEQAAVVKAGFIVLHMRWVVDRTYAWTERWGRTVMHLDRKLAVNRHEFPRHSRAA